MQRTQKASIAERTHPVSLPYSLFLQFQDGIEKRKMEHIQLMRYDFRPDMSRDENISFFSTHYTLLLIYRETNLISILQEILSSPRILSD